MAPIMAGDVAILTRPTGGVLATDCAIAGNCCEACRDWVGTPSVNDDNIENYNDNAPWWYVEFLADGTYEHLCMKWYGTGWTEWLYEMRRLVDHPYYPETWTFYYKLWIGCYTDASKPDGVRIEAGLYYTGPSVLVDPCEGCPDSCFIGSCLADMQDVTEHVSCVGGQLTGAFDLVMKDCSGNTYPPGWCDEHASSPGSACFCGYWTVTL